MSSRPHRPHHRSHAPRPPSSSATTSTSTSSTQQHHAHGQRASAAAPPSVPLTALGLMGPELMALRAALQQTQATSSAAGAAASSQGRLLMDPTSLMVLGQHFDRLLGAISGRLEMLNNATEAATRAQYDRSGNAIQMADAQIARFRAILQQIDEVELEFDKINRIREIVRGYRARVEEMDRRLRR